MDVVVNLVLTAFAVSGLSVTLTKAKVMEPVRRWLKKANPVIGYMAECPYCLSHWIALGFWPQFMDVNFFAFVFGEVATSAIITGVIMRALLWHEAEVQALREEIDILRNTLHEIGEAYETDREDGTKH